MDSEYGFIHEVKYDDAGAMYMEGKVLANVSSSSSPGIDESTRRLFEESSETGFVFIHMENMFGNIARSHKPVIHNTDPISTGRALPRGHPAVKSFLGIPFFEGASGKVLGVVGLANRPGGFSQSDVDLLQPLIDTCCNLIQAYGAIRENKSLIASLEGMVADRTRELQLANDDLEKASADQLTHFACMSHEIRYVPGKSGDSLNGFYSHWVSGLLANPRFYLLFLRSSLFETN